MVLNFENYLARNICVINSSLPSTQEAPPQSLTVDTDSSELLYPPQVVEPIAGNKCRVQQVSTNTTRKLVLQLMENWIFENEYEGGLMSATTKAFPEHFLASESDNCKKVSDWWSICQAFYPSIEDKKLSNSRVQNGVKKKFQNSSNEATITKMKYDSYKLMVFPVSTDTPSFISVELNYYAVCGARNFGAGRMGLQFDDLSWVTSVALSCLFLDCDINTEASITPIRQLIHPASSPEVSFKKSDIFRSRTSTTIQEIFSVKFKPQSAISARLYEHWIKDKEREEVRTFTLKEQKNHPSNKEIELTDKYTKIWLNLLNTNKAIISVIPEELVPFLGDVIGNPIRTKIAEQVVQCTPSKFLE
ncbi:hypothetical protein P9112_010480 [Eukaryota sp. TZLM1-RC]